MNLALTTSTVPSQWKQACIRPIQKVPTPKQHAAHFYYSRFNTGYGTIVRSAVSVPCFTVTSITCPAVYRPVCFSTDRLHYCCHNLSTPPSHQSSVKQFLRRSHIFGFFQGVRYCPAFSVVKQASRSITGLQISLQDTHTAHYFVAKHLILRIQLSLLYRDHGITYWTR